MESTIIQPSLLTPSQFAKKKHVTYVTVSNHIKKGSINIFLVGQYQDIYIDWNIYKDHEFNISHTPKKHLKQ